MKKEEKAALSVLGGAVVVLGIRELLKPHEGDTKCVGFDLYQYHEGQWVLLEANSTACGWQPPGEETGIIQGYVVGKDTGEHIPNAAIYLNGEFILYSQSDGSYYINNLSYGTHIIIIEADGYRTVTFSVEVSQEVQNINFKLVPTGLGGEILEFSVEPKQIYQQEEIVVQARIQNTSDVGELFYARVSINGQWSGSIIAVWVNPGEVYENSRTITLFNAGTFTVSCELTGYEKEDVRDQTSIQITVLPREIPNRLILELEPIHLYDCDYRGLIIGTPESEEWPRNTDAQLLSIPQAECRAGYLAMDINYSIIPREISVRSDEEGWRWVVWIFHEGDDYTFPYNPVAPAGHYSGAEPALRVGFEAGLDTASIREEVETQFPGGGSSLYPDAEPPPELLLAYPRSKGYTYTLKPAMYGYYWMVHLNLADMPGRCPVIIQAVYREIRGYTPAGNPDVYTYTRAWKVGEIVVP